MNACVFCIQERLANCSSQVLPRNSEVMLSMELKKVAFLSCHALRPLRNLMWAVNNYVCTAQAKLNPRLPSRSYLNCCLREIFLICLELSVASLPLYCQGLDTLWECKLKGSRNKQHVKDKNV